ncbi:MAG: D-aminoacyl-tRNA deacylase [Planctomycetota bacterium]|nr:D-aminoacyl-tRNA deacylase [Planctomycetota bacterium]
MRIVLQRVREAAVHVPRDDADDEVVGAIGRGVLLLVGVGKGDTEADADALVRKIGALRIFPGRTPMDRTLADVGGACLVVSQFTLLGTVRKGNRPGFDRAEDPARAEALYEYVAAGLRAQGLEVATGRFAATMAVHLVNDGPVTFVLEAEDGRVR